MFFTIFCPFLTFVLLFLFLSFFTFFHGHPDLRLIPGRIRIKRSGNFRIRIFRDHRKIFRADPDEILRICPELRIRMNRRSRCPYLMTSLGDLSYSLDSIIQSVIFSCNAKNLHFSYGILSNSDWNKYDIV